MTTTTAPPPPGIDVPTSSPFGWGLIGLGLAVVTWWCVVWSRVNALITGHVATNGPLPTSASDRAVLYGSGTPSEQRLSADLEAMSGLYPWGRLPLVLGVGVIVLGLFVQGGTSRSRVAIAIGASLVLLSVPMALFGDSARIALDILE